MYIYIYMYVYIYMYICMLVLGLFEQSSQKPLNLSPKPSERKLARPNLRSLKPLPTWAIIPYNPLKKALNRVGWLGDYKA